MLFAVPQVGAVRRAGEQQRQRQRQWCREQLHARPQLFIGRNASCAGTAGRARVLVARAAGDEQASYTVVASALTAMAAAGDDVYTLEQLLLYGLDPNFADGMGRTLLMHAIRGGQTDVASMLIRVVHVTGGDLSLADMLGRTALHEAVVGGHADLVAELLAAGANADARDVRDETPLLAAVDDCHDAVIAVLTQQATPDASVVSIYLRFV